LSKVSASSDLQASNLSIGSREYAWMDSVDQITIKVI
jgi:hypothetical protein